MPRLILLGTDGCHLCEQAEAIIADVIFELHTQLGVEYVTDHIDIAEHNEWGNSYADKIPVLLAMDYHQVLLWPFDNNQVRDFILLLS